MGALEDLADALADARDLKLRQLGSAHPRCRSCAESDPLALTGVDPDIVCYECRSIESDRDWIEAHHVSGRSNDAADTVDLPGNDHRVISTVQSGWDRDTLRNPDGSPLLRAAAAIRGWLDVLAAIIDQSVGWVPAFLEWLNAELREKLGPTWWVDLGWDA